MSKNLDPSHLSLLEGIFSFQSYSLTMHLSSSKWVVWGKKNVSTCPERSKCLVKLILKQAIMEVTAMSLLESLTVKVKDSWYLETPEEESLGVGTLKSKLLS
jgi:hypothetical protein